MCFHYILFQLLCSKLYTDLNTVSQSLILMDQSLIVIYIMELTILRRRCGVLLLCSQYSEGSGAIKSWDPELPPIFCFILPLLLHILLSESGYFLLFPWLLISIAMLCTMRPKWCTVAHSSWGTRRP